MDPGAAVLHEEKSSQRGTAKLPSNWDALTGSTLAAPTIRGLDPRPPSEPIQLVASFRGVFGWFPKPVEFKEPARTGRLG